MSLISRITIPSILLGSAAAVCLLVQASTSYFKLSRMHHLTVKRAAIQTTQGVPLDSLFTGLEPTVKIARWKNVAAKMQVIQRCRRSAFWRAERRIERWLGLDSVVYAQFTCDYCNTTTEDATCVNCGASDDPVQVFDPDPNSGTLFIGNYACGECELPLYGSCTNPYGSC